MGLTGARWRLPSGRPCCPFAPQPAGAAE
jgi:hypothetical protein